MAILHKHDKDGGFVAGDERTGFTSYAYPCSEHARRAKRGTCHAAEQAREMIGSQRRLGLDHELEYDAANWRRLGRQ